MKKLLFLFVSLICVCSFSLTVNARVLTTKEPTAENAIYIAGNPDMYPLEYYNEKTESYEGILPTFYESVSETTGIDFSYVSANQKSRQKELTENRQVEIVSAYIKGDITPQTEVELFTYSKDGKKETVCIGFTNIISADVEEAVKSTILQTDKDVWLSAAMSLEQNTNTDKITVYLSVTVIVLILALFGFILYMIKSHNKRKAQSQTKMNDDVTGIGNLMYFENCFKHHISAAVQPLYYVAYIAVDIEKVETYFGKEKSEELQRYAADTITYSIGDNDFVSRIDDGVFVTCFMAPDSERAVATANEMLNNLNAYNERYSQDNSIAFRCGIYPLSKQNISCETAIYNARQGYIFSLQEKQYVCLCNDTILGKVALKSRLQKKMDSAIENGEFHLYLQFVVDVINHRFCGAEVLSRWHNAEEGVLSPTNYIEDMKTAGMIERLDMYIFEKTCELLQNWGVSEFGGLYLSCNFTRTTLSSADFLRRFEEILKKYEFDRNNLIIELTEDSLADDSTTAYKNVLAIKNYGCRIALDDMGSGYTSFSDLCDYPIDIIKIDRHIVTKSVSSRGNAVLTGIIGMAHALGIQVLCEGIENETEDTRVKNAKCDYIQGFLYSRVLPVDNAVDFYKRKNI